MSTPFDEVIAEIVATGYHNHRLEQHSDTISDGVIRDLRMRCAPLREDLKTGVVHAWKNVSSPGDRLRKADLLVGEPGLHGRPDIGKVRLALENKSVITAHRNRTNRFDNLKKVLGAIHGARPEALVVATALVGLAERVLNIPDGVGKYFRDRGREREFETEVLPRLSAGDASLFTEFSWAVSQNRSGDPQRTVELFRTLPTRKPGHTHVEGFDYVMLVPVAIDNVHAPTIPRPNDLGIDVDAEYDRMLGQLCAAYTARWHM